MKGVLVRLQEYEEKASGAERELVRFILEHPDRAAGLNTHQLAEETFSSSSSVVRMCQKAGFSGYKEFQRELIAELAVRRENDRGMEKDIQKEDSLEKIIMKVTYRNMLSLEKTRKLLDENIVKKCIDLMESCENIYLFGIGSSLLVAKDAYLKFLRVNKPCFVCDDWHVQMLYAKNITKKDLAIIISYSGYTEEMITCAELAKEAGAPIVAITRFADSKLSRIADYKLHVAATELLVRSGAMSSRISQLDVIDILYTAYMNRHFEENTIQAKKTYLPKKQEEGGGADEKRQL